jgi:hypothetical protein
MKSDLISLGGNLEQPRMSKPSDYPAVGPSGAEGMSSGAGQLVKQTPNQEGPMHTQDSGDMTSSVWGKDGEFKVGQAKGEGTAVKCDWSVSLETGMVSPDPAMKY